MGIEALDFFSLDVDDIFNALQTAFNHEKRFLGYYQAIRFKHRRRDHGVADSGFVFKADEHKTFGRAGTLTANDIARDADRAAVDGF